MAGQIRSKNGVAEFILGLAEVKTRGLAYVPAIQVFLVAGSQDLKTWMPGTSPGMTKNRARHQFPAAFVLSDLLHGLSDLNALLIHESLFSAGSAPPDLTIR